MIINDHQYPSIIVTRLALDARREHLEPSQWREEDLALVRVLPARTVDEIVRSYQLVLTKAESQNTSP
eukprot:5212639-Pleurochrysis_carterae.AAC.1